MRNVLLVQAALILATTTVLSLYQGNSVLLPALYGGAVALASALLLLRRGAQVEEIAKTDPQQGVYHLYLGVVQRFILVLVLLGVGLGYLKLTPLPVLATFTVAQLAYMLAGARRPS